MLTRDARAPASMRGLVVWKTAVVLALGVGGVIGASRVMQAPGRGDTAVAPPVRVVDRPAANGSPPAAPTPADAGRTDPFAGVDVNDNAVLRHIAGIEEKRRAGAAARTPSREPVRTAAAPAKPTALVEARVPAAQPAATSAPTATMAPVPAVPADATVETVRPVVPATTADAQPAVAPAPRVAAEPAPPAAQAAGTPVLAAARLEPTFAPPAAAAPLRVINRTVPTFPVDAIRAGLRGGRVVARLSIDGDGRVVATDLVSASPPGYFERESRRALATWRYEATGQPTTVDVELLFTRN